jgi:hypothetical protein
LFDAVQAKLIDQVNKPIRRRGRGSEGLLPAASSMIAA